MAKEKIEFNPDLHSERLAELLKDSSDNKLKAESYLEIVKGNRQAAVEELGLKPKQFNALLTMYHSDTRERFENEKDEMVDRVFN